MTGAWIAFRLVGSRSGRDGFGARLVLTARRSGRSFQRVRDVRSARSYLAACDPRLRFGLGPEPVEVENVEIRWPSGQRQRIERPELRRVHVIEEPK